MRSEVSLREDQLESARVARGNQPASPDDCTSGWFLLLILNFFKFLKKPCDGFRKTVQITACRVEAIKQLLADHSTTSLRDCLLHPD